MAPLPEITRKKIVHVLNILLGRQKDINAQFDAYNIPVEWLPSNVKVMTIEISEKCFHVDLEFDETTGASINCQPVLNLLTDNGFRIFNQAVFDNIRVVNLMKPLREIHFESQKIITVLIGGLAGDKTDDNR